MGWNMRKPPSCWSQPSSEFFLFPLFSYPGGLNHQPDFSTPSPAGSNILFCCCLQIYFMCLLAFSVCLVVPSVVVLTHGICLFPPGIMTFIFLTVVGVSPTSFSLPMFAISFFHPTARAPPTPPDWRSLSSSPKSRIESGRVLPSARSNWI